MYLKDHYNELWEQSLLKFRDHKFQLDSVLNSDTDNRYGVSLIARPSKEVKHNLLKVLDKIRAVAPGQYYYPTSDLHITILTIISCYDGFSLDQIEPADYQKIVQSSVESIPPFTIEFRGLTASPSCILVQGFPNGSQLTDLRAELRKRFKNSALQHSVDQRYTLQTAHMTAIRFKKPFENADRFIDIITQFRDADFGGSVIDQVELVGNDWYQKKEKAISVGRFPLE